MARRAPSRFILPLADVAVLPHPGTGERLDRPSLPARALAQLRAIQLYDLLPMFFGVKKQDLAVFSRQLATFVGAGVPLTQAIAVLYEEARSRKMRAVLADLQDQLRKGSSVSEAMARHGAVFSPLYLNLVRAAELTGTLDVVLRRLDIQLSREDKTRRQFSSALMYPVLVLLMAAVSVGVLIGFVLPRFSVLFAEFHAELPFTTRLLLSFAQFTTANQVQLLAGLGALILLVVVSQRFERGRYARDTMVLKLPVIGTLSRYAAVARFCRTLSTMIESGVPINRSLDVVLGSVANRVTARRLRPVKARMLAGEGFAGPLGDTGVFPPTVIQMIRVGEETGALERFLGEAAAFYENELEFKLQGAVQLLEPALLLSVGGVIGFVTISLVSAIYALTGAIR
ncbi:MAG: type II secretion system F family protein [Chloroflexi bacterium]|nr:type II secretion system F family protein [Chloroflexota bacterium]